MCGVGGRVEIGLDGRIAGTIISEMLVVREFPSVGAEEAPSAHRRKERNNGKRKALHTIAPIWLLGLVIAKLTRKAFSRLDVGCGYFSPDKSMSLSERGK